MSDRTELEWTYEPANLLETPYQSIDADFELIFCEGRIIAALRVPQDPVDTALENQITQRIKEILLSRQIQVHQEFQIQGPRILQHVDGKKHISIHLEGAVFAVSGGRADFVVTDANGLVVTDTKAKRIFEERAVLDLIISNVAKSPTLRTILESHSKSISDHADEFVHLYEVRDALKTHFKSEEEAQKALGIEKTEWQRIGKLANSVPIEQGRHRGTHTTGRRPATPAELTEARSIIKSWIIKFARNL